VTAEGEIDATNSRDLGRYVERQLRPTMQCSDLRAVEFFGAQGFLRCTSSQCCTRRDVDWVVVGDRDLERLLDILDPDHVLPSSMTSVRRASTSNAATAGAIRYPGRCPADGTQLTPRRTRVTRSRGAWRPPSVGEP
jgi:hypothetical protein